MLYFVPTPIGNLGDITLRALEVLKKANVVLCEDGRVTSQLFRLLKIENKPRFVNLIKAHIFNEKEVLEVFENLEKTGFDNCDYSFQQGDENLENEFVVAVVTDAGTPGISDPGFEVIKLAQQNGVAYTTLPGATAVTPAVVNSGLVGKEFLFLGFLPIKKGRQKLWQKIVESEYPVILYESNHRIGRFIKEAGEYLDQDRKVCFCREISKKFEQIWVGSVAELVDLKIKEKGEFVVVVGV